MDFSFIGLSLGYGVVERLDSRATPGSGPGSQCVPSEIPMYELAPDVVTAVSEELT